MRKIVTLSLLVVTLLTLVGCKSSNAFTEGDFKYYKTQGISYIIGLTDDAKDKTHLVVPKTASDFPIAIGRSSLFNTNSGTIKSEQLERLYVFTTSEAGSGLSSEYLPSIEKIFYFYIQGVDFDFEDSDTYIGSYGPSINEHFYPNNISSFYANVSYHYNYEDAPDEGYYFIDDYDNELITYIPVDPIRDGYQFLGWYKDAATTIPWNFEIDKVPAKVYENEEYQFVETKVYAKWGI